MIRRWMRNNEGSVLLMTVLAVLVLVAVAGSSVDFGREQMVKLKLQQSSDAAALAAGLLPTGATDADKRATALRYFALNYPAEYLGIPRPTPVVNIGSTIEVSASAIVETKFIRNVGIKALTAVGRSVVANNGPTTATTQSPVDMLLLMDNSNSMAAADVGGSNTREVPPALRASVHAAGVQACQDFFVTLAPAFGTATGYLDFCNNAVDRFDPYSPVTKTGGDNVYHFGLLGPTRINALRYAANALASQVLASGSDSRIGAVTWASDVIATLPPSSDPAVVGNFLDRMYAIAGTNSATGLSQALTMAGGLDTRKVRAVVLMTDGINTQSAPLGCFGHPNCQPYDDNTPEHCNGNDLCHRANELSLPLCQRLKDSGVQVYTVAFGGNVTGTGADAAAARTFLQSCASISSDGSVNYQEAPDAAALTRAFTTIVQSVGKLRIID